MLQYIVKRLILMAVTLFGIAVITFALTRMTPGEPAVIAQGAGGAGAQAAGGYEAALEQNRRNLGLDKPLLFNTNFEDRDYAAREAVHDYLRPPKFWQNDAQKRMRLSSTIALGPAIEVAEKLGTVTGHVDHNFKPTNDVYRRIDIEDARKRLVDALPSLAQARVEDLAGKSIDEKIAFWKKWRAENAARWEPEAVSASVAKYLDGQATLEEVVPAGGYAIPLLIDALETTDDARLRRANLALTGLSGFDYLTSPDSWDAEKDEIVAKWRSLYKREKIRFSDPGPVGNAINVVRNTQFGLWVGQLVTFDFGQSYKHKRSVNRLLLERIPVSMILSGLSIIFSYIIAIPLGIFSAAKKNSAGDKLVTVMLFVLYSLPSFWVAQMLLLTLTGGPTPWGAEWPNLFPTRGLNDEAHNWRSGNFADLADLAHHVVLPVVCLTYGSLAFLSRQMRAAMLEVINQDYIRTARAKGLAPRAVIFKHTVRNSLIPIVTISAGLLPELFAGAIIIEQIFTIPGMGQLSFEAILNRDYPVINAILFFSALLTLLGILLADLTYALVDPRISYD